MALSVPLSRSPTIRALVLHFWGRVFPHGDQDAGRGKLYNWKELISLLPLEESARDRPALFKFISRFITGRVGGMQWLIKTWLNAMPVAVWLSASQHSISHTPGVTNSSHVPKAVGFPVPRTSSDKTGWGWGIHSRTLSPTTASSKNGWETVLGRPDLWWPRCAKNLIACGLLADQTHFWSFQLPCYLRILAK